jgi:hypothetical protein
VSGGRSNGSPEFPVVPRTIWHAYGTVLPSASNVPRQSWDPEC